MSTLNLFSTVFFAIAIIHVFIADKFQKLARKAKGGIRSLYAFLGNTPILFGLWLLPLFVLMIIIDGPQSPIDFLQSINYQEPIAYFVLITIATVRPLLQFFETLIFKFSRSFKNWIFPLWFSPILLGALLSGCFSNVAMIALVAFHFSSTLFSLKMSKNLIYFTFSILIIAIATGPTIIPVNFNFFFKVLEKDISHLQIFQFFGWKTFVSLVVLLIGGGFLFRKEFKALQKTEKLISKELHRISARHWFYAALFLIGSFGKGNIFILLLVLATVIILHKGFYREKGKEGKLSLYLPIIIAFFTATLEIQARLQSWWVDPFLAELRGFHAFFGSYVVTGLNEHVSLEGLKNLVNNPSQSLLFLSFLGVLAGGGLTLISKSGNIIAKKVLKIHFPDQTVSPFYHLLYSIPLTFALALIIFFFHFLGV